MAIIKKATNNKCRQCHGDTCSYTVGISIGVATMEKSMELSQKKKKPKIKLSYDPTILLLDIYLKKKMKAII